MIEKKLLKFEAEGREFAKFLGSLEQFIQIVKGQNNFRNAFLTCSWRFLRSKKSEQFKLEKILRFKNMQEKIENNKKFTGQLEDVVDAIENNLDHLGVFAAQ